MKNTIIIYETYYGTTKKAADIFALIMGNCKTVDIKNEVCDLTPYKNIIFMFAFHGFQTAENIKKFMSLNLDKLQGKTIAYCGVGLMEKDSSRYYSDLNNSLGRSADFIYFVQGELRVKKLTESDKEILKNFMAKQNMKLMDMGKFKVKETCETAEKCRLDLNSPEVRLENESLKNEIEKFLKAHNTCALATSTNNLVRATPIEYIYDNNTLYFITEGGLKYRGILQNFNAAVCIYDSYTNMQNIKGMQIEGETELIPIGSEEYVRILSIKKLDMDKIKKIPINMNMFKIKIRTIEFLNSDFRKVGKDSKQIIHYN